MSINKHRTKAYDADLRCRIVYQRKAMGFTLQKVAENLGVSVATAYRTEELFDETGDVCKRMYPPGHGNKKQTDVDALFIVELLVERPATYLKEIQMQLEQRNGTHVDIATICRFLRKNGFTRKQLQSVALQRSERLRSEFAQEISIFSRDMYIFIDETGADRRNATRKFGYSLRGKPEYRLLVRGKRISAISAMTVDGILDCHIVEGSVNADTFEDFIEKSLLPHLLPFNGSNPNSIVVLDNCSIHHVDHIVELLESTGILVIFLPPYSPDLNPIEEAFSKVKACLRENELALQVMDDPTNIVLAAFASITPQNCLEWVLHSGY